MAKTSHRKKGTAPPFKFTARLVETLYGNVPYASVLIPSKILDLLPAGRLRTKGFLNDIPFSLAVQYRKDGRSFFVFSRPICKKAGVNLGNSVTILFYVVDKDLLELPEELEIVLAQDAEAKKVWDSFSTGLRRSLALYVSPVKNVDGRIKRALEMASKMKAGLLLSQIVGKNKKIKS